MGDGLAATSCVLSSVTDSYVSDVRFVFNTNRTGVPNKVKRGRWSIICLLSSDLFKNNVCPYFREKREGEQRIRRAKKSKKNTKSALVAVEKLLLIAIATAIASY